MADSGLFPRSSEDTLTRTHITPNPSWPPGGLVGMPDSKSLLKSNFGDEQFGKKRSGLLYWGQQRHTPLLILMSMNPLSRRTINVHEL